MEFLEGETLRNVLQSVKIVPVGEAVDIAAELCDALEYMHKHNIVHRDLKPENIMICNDGRVKIMDFGIAKATGMRRITFTGFSPAMGTPDYMAPEQVKGKRGDARTDIYSLGAILYEMVTGQPPFEGTNPLAIMNARLMGDPDRAAQIESRTFRRKWKRSFCTRWSSVPRIRYPSAAAMKAELDAPDEVVVTGRADRLRPPAQWTGSWRPPRTVVFALIPIIVFGLMFIYFHYFAHH